MWTVAALDSQRMSAGASWSKSFGAATDSAMRVYDEVMVPRMFEPWAQVLTDGLELSPGETLLDVACGPGSVARVAAQRLGKQGRVIACDLSPAMLGIAREKAPVEDGAPITYVESPADRLPVADDELDVITCQQGLQFFGDRKASVAEMRRALRPGGRIGVAVWSEIEHSPAWAALADAIETVAGPELAERLRNGPWGFTDKGRLAALFETAGFADVRVSTRSLPLTFDGGASQLASTLVAGGIAKEVEQFSAEQREQLVGALAASLGDGPIESEMESNLLTARG